jgi:hypothetical protein
MATFMTAGVVKVAMLTSGLAWKGLQFLTSVVPDLDLVAWI